MATKLALSAEGRVVYVLKYFVINSYFQKLTGQFCLVTLTSDEITIGLGKDKGSVPEIYIT